MCLREDEGYPSRMSLDGSFLMRESTRNRPPFARAYYLLAMSPDPVLLVETLPLHYWSAGSGKTR